MKITMNIVIGFSLLITVMSTNVAGQQNSAVPRPLIVGTKEAPPFSMKSSDGQWTGLSIDLWRQIAAELNLQFEFRELALKQLLEGVSDGSLDAAVAALTITPEREKKLTSPMLFIRRAWGLRFQARWKTPGLLWSDALFRLHF
jgi:polar amino acid transport system substrate-binding protein